MMNGHSNLMHETQIARDQQTADAFARLFSDFLPVRVGSCFISKCGINQIEMHSYISNLQYFVSLKIEKKKKNKS